MGGPRKIPEMTRERAVELVRWGPIYAKPKGTEPEFRLAIEYLKEHGTGDEVIQVDRSKYPKK